jgi:hypothetical protein
MVRHQECLALRVNTLIVKRARRLVKSLLQLDGRHSARQLLERALLWRLVEPPSHQARAVTEAIAGDVIIAHFNHELGAKRLPLGGPRRAPAAWTAWRVSREAGRGHKPFQAFGKGRLFVVGESRGKAHMMKETFVVVEAEQQ